MPEDDVGVVYLCGGWVGGNPGREALGGFAGGLGDVAASGVKLVVVVCGVGVSFCNQWVANKGRMVKIDVHLVTWMACLANPARFHTRPFFLGKRVGTSRLTSL